MSFKEFKAIPTLNKEHENFVSDYWTAGYETTWCTFLKMDGRFNYKFDYGDEFFRAIIGLKKDKVLLKDGESMTSQEKFVDEV